MQLETLPPPGPPLPGPGTKPPQPRLAHEEIIHDREVLLSSFAYVPVLCLVPIIVRCPSEFIAFHVRHGMALMLVELVAAMLLFLPRFGTGIAILLFVPSLIASFLGFLRTRRRQRWEIPLISKLAEFLNL